MTDQTQSIKIPASAPDADLACDFAVAREVAQERARFADAMIGSPRALDDGVEITFRGDAWDLVLQYIEVESQCCPFLNLAGRKQDGYVILTVTGRPDAQPIIAQIFAGDAQARA